MNSSTNNQLGATNMTGRETPQAGLTGALFYSPHLTTLPAASVVKSDGPQHLLSISEMVIRPPEIGRLECGVVVTNNRSSSL
jgi:hypothetical protein